ncbi:MAG: ATP-binding domain-containing protein, partial [Anaerolineae bacterium]|nr:ATP-binding domain-containing protein [Anaerolineae bacterium]
KNFRNSREILDAARGVIEACESLKEASEYVPPTSTNRTGLMKPVLTVCDSPYDELVTLTSEIVRLCQGGLYRPGDFAVLARTDKHLQEVESILAERDVPCRHFRSDEFEVLENYVKLITMHSAKGLEFPAVMLLGVNEGVIPFNNPDEEQLDQDRKLLYVGMTRAADRLYIYHSKGQTSRFLHDIQEGTCITRKAY